MIERLVHSNRVEISERPRPKRTPAGRQNDLGDLVSSTGLKALEDGGMFAVDRQQRGAMLLGERRDKGPADNKGFLIGQREILAGFERLDRAEETGGADHGRDDDVDLG